MAARKTTKVIKPVRTTKSIKLATTPARTRKAASTGATKVPVKVTKNTKQSFLSQLLANQTQISFILGAIVVAVLAILLFRYFERPNDNDITPEQPTQNQTQDNQILTNNTETPSDSYTVKAGDSLWSIAASELKDGYKWGEIAEANNITNPSQISEGMTLKIPQTQAVGATAVAQASPTPPLASPVDVAMATSQSSAPAQPDATHTQDSVPTTYNVVAGDTLWAISVKHYNDGYMWTKIAQANNLSNPDIIHSGNVLTLPSKP